MKFFEKVSGITCPYCGSDKYIRWIKEKDSYFTYKCINCLRYLKEDDIMKTVTKKKQLLTKKQKEFFDFVKEKVTPFFEAHQMRFDTINPTLMQDEWYGNNILVTIPYGDRMEPWLLRAINECYAYEDKTITVVMGAKVNTNAWHKYVFPFAEEIAFVRGGKRPTAIVIYSYGCKMKAFYSACDDTIVYTGSNIESNIDDYMIHGFAESYFLDDKEKHE